MKKIIISATILITGFTARAQSTAADNQNASQSVTLNLQNSISIIIGIGFDNNTAPGNSNSLHTGQSSTNNSSIKVKSNRQWALTVNLTSANSTASNVESNPGVNNESRNYRMAIVYTATQL